MDDIGSAGEEQAPGRTTTVRTVRGADLPPLGLSTTGGPFDPAQFQAVRNQVDVSGKPTGGLWLAPLLEPDPGASTGALATAWTALALSIRGTETTTYRVRLVDDATVAVIDDRDDFDAVAATWPPGRNPLLDDLPDTVRRFVVETMSFGFDYEAMSRDVDALWLTAAGAARNRETNRMNLWDIESVLLLNVAAVEPPGPTT